MGKYKNPRGAVMTRSAMKQSSGTVKNNRYEPSPWNCVRGKKYQRHRAGISFPWFQWGPHILWHTHTLALQRLDNFLFWGESLLPRKRLRSSESADVDHNWPFRSLSTMNVNPVVRGWSTYSYFGRPFWVANASLLALVFSAKDKHRIDEWFIFTAVVARVWKCILIRISRLFKTGVQPLFSNPEQCNISIKCSHLGSCTIWGLLYPHSQQEMKLFLPVKHQ